MRPGSDGIIVSRLVTPRAVVVYAPLGAQTRFRRARHAEIVAENWLAGAVISVIVRVAGCIDDFTVPAAWIDPPGAPVPEDRVREVVIDIRTRRPFQPDAVGHRSSEAVR